MALLLALWRVVIRPAHVPGARTERVELRARTAASARFQARRFYPGHVVVSVERVD